MFTSAAYNYDETNKEEDSNISIQSTFSEAADSQTTIDALTPKGYQTPAQQIAQIQRELNTGSMDLERLEKIMGKLTNLSAEGIPASFEAEFDTILKQTSAIVNSVDSSYIPSHIHSAMAELGMTTRNMDQAPTMQPVAAPAPSMGA